MPAKPSTKPNERTNPRPAGNEHARPIGKRAAEKVRAPAAKSAPAAAPGPGTPQLKAHKADKHAVKARPPLVRDSFTMPEGDFALLATLKSAALGAQRAAKKSEFLRAGLHALAALDATALVAALDRLDVVNPLPLVRKPFA